jgi:hypothetical protein
MYKILTISMLAMVGLFVLTGTADAGWWRRARCYSEPVVTSPAPAPAPAAPATAEAQGRVYRSYSYEPAYQYERSYRSNRGSYPTMQGMPIDAGRKIRGM